MKWYYRENADSELVGPMTYYVADKQARALSRDEKKSGLAELLVYSGTRNGDPPPVGGSKLQVVYMYIRGVRVLAGKKAQYHSDNRLPPTK